MRIPQLNFPMPTYEHICAENNYLKHVIAHQGAVIAFQQETIEKLQHDALRWKAYKSVMLTTDQREKVEAVEAELEKNLATNEQV